LNPKENKPYYITADFLKRFISTALKEDIGEGDHTTLGCVPSSAKGKVVLLVKDTGIIAGVELARLIFKKLDASLKFKKFISDGALVRPGDKVFTVEGSSRSLLTGERLVLNCMQRMSGIATHTAALNTLCAGTKAKVIDTRKTTPNFRLLEKWAVRIGGGANHRIGLYDMILIKDNHVEFSGGIAKAVNSVRAYLKKKKKKLKIEVEVRNMQELQEVMQLENIDRVLLDNFTPEQMLTAVNYVGGKIPVEASGGINADTIGAYAATGVDFISVGALTHSIRSLDLSLKAV
jgi:nicotinate-nucleotide pyrophosphorylase (carboxylating)